MKKPSSSIGAKTSTLRTPKRRHVSAADKTAEKKRRFIERFAITGRVDLSAKLVGVARSGPYRWADEDPDFLEAWNKATAESASVLEDEAHRRAYDGVRKPVYQSGRRVGYVQEYSDTLLIFLLKGLKPGKYRENVSHEHAGKGGGPIKAQVVSDETIAEIRRRMIGDIDEDG